MTVVIGPGRTGADGGCELADDHGRATHRRYPRDFSALLVAGLFGDAVGQRDRRGLVVGVVAEREGRRIISAKPYLQHVLQVRFPDY